MKICPISKSNMDSKILFLTSFLEFYCTEETSKVRGKCFTCSREVLILNSGKADFKASCTKTSVLRVLILKQKCCRNVGTCY